MSVYRVGGNKSSQNVFPSVRPTLDLDFANSKTLDPRITFTRASGGSYVGADGLIKYAGVNEARFDHDPVTGESLGLLVEEARTNNVLSSQDFTTLWFPNGSSRIISNAILSPSGNLDGSKYVEAEVNQENYIRSSARTLSAGTYTASVYVHESSERRLWLRPVHIGPTHSTSAVVFDPKTKTLGSLTGFGISASATNAGGGWWRVSLTFTTPDTRNIQHGINAITSTAIYTGDGTSGIYVWGAQLEVGAFPTSYIPTQGSTRTRAADDCIITGKNFSEWYRQDEGTIFAKGKSSSDTDTSTNVRSGIVWLAPLDATLRGIYLTTRKDGNNQIELAVRDDDGTTSLSTNHILTSGYKVAGSYDKNLGILRFSLDGEPTKISNQPTLLGFNTTQALLVIGSGVPFGSNSTTRKPNSTISKITYYPRALTPSQIQALTR
jgi:hypothetical protein